MDGDKTQPLTRDQILDAAVEVLRRHGLEKTAVVDVARALGMSHGSIYRHFKSKEALIDAVAERWLATVSEPLAAIAESRRGPEARLRLWFETLVKLKRKKVLDDPELFAVYHAVAEAAHVVVRRHVAELHRQLIAIVEDGGARGEFRLRQPELAAVALFDGTMRFHHPALVGQNIGAAADNQLALTLDLLIAGLKAGVV
jgi:AcrR family transcriptional regulator